MRVPLPVVPLPNSSIVMCMWYTVNMERRLFDINVREGILSARVLRAVSRPLYPVTLYESEPVRVLVTRIGAAALWGSHVALRLDPVLRLHVPVYRAAGDDGSDASIVRPSPYVFKLSAMMHSLRRNARVVFLDNDVYVLAPNFAHTLLAFTLQVSDVAMPLAPGRSEWEVCFVPLRPQELYPLSMQ
jgi:hypothetical protein